MFPDFLIIRKNEKGLVVDILEPHGSHLSDSLAKAKALAKYARGDSGNLLGKVLFIRDKKGKKGQFQSLDMMDYKVSERVLAMNANESLDDVFANFGLDYPENPDRKK